MRACTRQAQGVRIHKKNIYLQKKPIVVDTMGNLLAVEVHPGNLHDTRSGLFLVIQAYDAYPSLQKFCGDAGYRGTFVKEIAEFLERGVDISERITPKFAIFPKRWVAERAFAWMGHSRRLSKDCELRIHSAETMILISNFRTLLRRLVG